MKQIYQARTVAEAHLLRTALEAEGIRAFVQGETLQTIVPRLPFLDAYPTVHVADEDVEAATVVLDQFRAERAPTHDSPWRCPVCGEMIEPQFAECWKCAGHVRPARIDRDVPCRKCGYNLLGLQMAGECPECGEPIAPSYSRAMNLGEH